MNNKRNKLNIISLFISIIFKILKINIKFNVYIKANNTEAENADLGFDLFLFILNITK